LHTEAIYDKAKLSGAVTEYYENAKIRSKGAYEVKGRFKKRTGHWTTFYEAGEKESEGEYIDNDKAGRWQEWYANGNQREDGFFEKGAYDGKYKDYFENGQLRSEGEFKSKGKLKLHGNHGFWIPLPTVGFTMKRESVMHGMWKYYDDRGTLMRQEAWFNGSKR